MRCMVLASDYDGTLADAGRVAESTWEAVDRLRASGRHLVLVTGRELDDLLSLCDRVDRFTLIVAENGGVIYSPATRERTLLAPPPPPEFVEAMRKSGVKHLGVSQTIVATVKPYDEQAHAAIRDLGLDLHVVYNGDAVMILPPGMSKASGLLTALEQLSLSPRNAVGVGDAQNDHPLLDACEISAAVGNAIDALKAHADIVLDGECGAGVAQLIDAMLDDDLAHVSERLTRRNLLLGQRVGGDQEEAEQQVEETLAPQNTVALVAGQSGGGKSTLITGLMERLVASGYQFCALDPEGDFDTFEDALPVGDAQTAPKADDVARLVHQPSQSVLVNMMRVTFADRPAHCAAVLAQMQKSRALTGRPHWMIFDEAHHFFPSSINPADEVLPDQLAPALFVTVHPEQLSSRLLERVTVFIGAGPGAEISLKEFARAARIEPPADMPGDIKTGEALVWRRKPGDDGWSAPCVVRVEPAKTQRRRHVRKYAEGMLIPERSFYFRGPEDKLNLRAHNLVLFLELAEGVDEETWLFHLRRGDYSTWFRDVIGDDALADEARAAEANEGLSAKESIEAIRKAVEERYTQPENPVVPNILAPGSKDGGGTSSASDD
ncbi:HAD family hydrolase [Caballeronia sp. Lep1P3]|uniref:HAD hydrolase family protein n=1 Tax=Caballeronia sp. Lep1P3 TaxID=2878150 RepID=UPI001FD0DE9B|nr:HAD family hydrolase [Caballeronia sp. Lep1P3]